MPGRSQAYFLRVRRDISGASHPAAGIPSAEAFTRARRIEELIRTSAVSPRHAMLIGVSLTLTRVTMMASPDRIALPAAFSRGITPEVERVARIWEDVDPFGHF